MINIGVIVVLQNFSVASISPSLSITLLLLGRSVVDGLDSMVISSSSSSSWLKIVSIFSSLSFQLNFLVDISFMDAFFAVKQDNLFLLFIIFLIGRNFALGVCSSSLLLLLSSNLEVLKSPFNSLSLSGSSVFVVFFFSSHLHLLHYPCFIILCFRPFSHLHLVLLLESWVSSCD